MAFQRVPSMRSATETHGISLYPEALARILTA
jgi:hypothetical protein